MGKASQHRKKCRCVVVPRDELLRWKTVFRLRPEFRRGAPWSGFLASAILHAGFFTALAVAPHFAAREVVVSCPVEVRLEPPRLYAVEVEPVSGAKKEAAAEPAAEKIEVPVEEKPSPLSSQSQAVAASAVGESNYWQQVRTAVASRVRYPDSARINHIEGYALVKLTIDGEGRLCGVEAIECSSKVFGRYATEAVVRAAPFPAPSNAGTPPLSALIPVYFKVNNKTNIFAGTAILSNGSRLIRDFRLH